MATRNGRPASVADVAKAAGVSTQTVSRVANGVTTVLPENRDKVLRAMRELGYTPNLAARTLKRGKFNAVGVAMYNIFATGNLKILEGISKAANEAGYSLDLFTFDVDQGATFESVMARLGGLPVDGALFVAGWLAVDAPKIELPGNMPIGIITPLDNIPYSTVGDDSEACSEQVVDYFYQRGHRGIYHVSGPSTSISGVRRREGWEKAMARRGLRAPEVYEGDWSADSGYRAARFIAERSDCTAVYVSCDEMAYGLMLGLEELGKHVPDDISIIGVDDSLEGIVPNLNLTSFRIKSDDGGRLAFERVVSMIDGAPRDEVSHMLIVGELIERGTVSSV